MGLGRTLHNGGAQSATGFGGQFGNVDFPEKIVAVGETQKLEWKGFFKRIVENVDWRGWVETVLTERHSD